MTQIDHLELDYIFYTLPFFRYELNIALECVFDKITGKSEDVNVSLLFLLETKLYVDALNRDHTTYVNELYCYLNDH